VTCCLLLFGYQYQCSGLPGKTSFRNDLLCVEWDTLHIHSLTLWLLQLITVMPPSSVELEMPSHNPP